ncbi:MAG TPA: hypothetical protein VMU57_10705 [Edaphobacter sp.]|uniref:hypothetical protein n=1 Tax=Edaphobacter sp. TaxID=1934404 RepID=UPI002C535E0D|nr:hypothetical protein [Edaphobacter sp.]HUZ95373.1 hypothetical protein [Edaphobacter sp.]
MRSGTQVVDEKPDWSPLETLFDMDVRSIDQFMHMGRVGTLQLYKHRGTRRYLYIDAESGLFYENSDAGYVEVSKAHALGRVLSVDG